MPKGHSLALPACGPNDTTILTPTKYVYLIALHSAYIKSLCLASDCFDGLLVRGKDPGRAKLHRFSRNRCTSQKRGGHSTARVVSWLHRERASIAHSGMNDTVWWYKHECSLPARANRPDHQPPSVQLLTPLTSFRSPLSQKGQRIEGRSLPENGSTKVLPGREL